MTYEFSGPTNPTAQECPPATEQEVAPLRPDTEQYLNRLYKHPNATEAIVKEFLQGEGAYWEHWEARQLAMRPEDAAKIASEAELGLVRRYRQFAMAPFTDQTAASLILLGTESAAVADEKVSAYGYFLEYTGTIAQRAVADTILEAPHGVHWRLSGTTLAWPSIALKRKKPGAQVKINIQLRRAL